MKPKDHEIITVQILENLNYGFTATYQEYSIFIDASELSWKSPVPEAAIPKTGDRIRIMVITSDKEDFDYLGSVKAVNPQENPWYNPDVYVTGDNFIGEIEEIHSFGSWAIHPKGAFVRIMKDLRNTGLQPGSKVKMKILDVLEENQILDGEILEEFDLDQNHPI